MCRIVARWIAACAALTCLAGTAGAAENLPESLLARSRELQTRAQWAASESLAVVAVAHFEQQAAPDSLALAEGLLRIGTARWKLSSHADGVGLAAAQRCLGIRERALGPAHLDVAAAHALLGHLLVASGQAEAAVIHAERALEIRRVRLDPGDPVLADAWSLLGNVHRTREQFLDARAAYAQALAILERELTQNAIGIALVLGYDAACRIELGQIDEARTQLERADAVIVSALGLDAAQRQNALGDLASLERVAGDLATAIDRSREAIRVIEVSSPDDVMALANRRANLGTLLMTFGDWTGALSTFLDALPVFVQHYGPMHERTAALKSRIGIAVGGLGNHQESLTWLREAEAAYAARPGPPDPGLAIAWRWQAEIHHLMGEHARARELCERAITAARGARRPRGDSIIAPLYLLVSVLERSGDLAALDRAARSLPEVAEEFDMNSPVTQTNVNYWSARAARRLGRTEDAWRLALQAEQIARERVLLNARSLPDRRALELSDRQARNLDLVIEIAADDEYRVNEAWDRLARSRGVVRAEMTRRRLPRALLDDPEVVAAQSRWIEAQAQLARQRVESIAAEPDSAQRAVTEQLGDAAEEAEREMRALLAGRFEPAAGTEVGLMEIFARLGRDRALVSMVEVDAGTDSARVVAFVRRAEQGSTSRIELGASDALRGVVDSWRNVLAAPPGASIQSSTRAEATGRRLGASVRQRVWDPIAAHVANAPEVFVVADGPLMDLPWHALPDGEHSYLVETGPLVVLLEAERELLGDDRLPAASSLLAIGDPDFERNATRSVALDLPSAPLALRSAPDPCAGAAQLAFPRLPETAIEASAAVAIWNEARGGEWATLLAENRADELSVRQQAVGKTVLHFATHGYVSADTCGTRRPGTRGVGGVAPLVVRPRPASPWSARRVWLALAGANHASTADRAAVDGLLSAEEVVTLDLRDARWVVLSACHSGWSDEFTREGSSGLRRAFRVAGASTVISSQWALDDKATREWMAVFYDAATRGGQNASSSLATACRTSLQERRDTGRTTHPFYWAGFTAVGR